MLLPAVSLAACAPSWECDGSESACPDGVPVYLPTELAAMRDVEGRLRAQLETALAYWSLPRSTLDGWKLEYHLDEWVECGGYPGFSGCWDGHEKTIRLAYWAGMSGCVEAAPLPHEIGHFVASHGDARFCGWAPLVEELRTVPECGDGGWELNWSYCSDAVTGSAPDPETGTR